MITTHVLTPLPLRGRSSPHLVYAPFSARIHIISSAIMSSTLLSTHTRARIELNVPQISETASSSSFALRLESLPCLACMLPSRYSTYIEYTDIHTPPPPIRLQQLMLQCPPPPSAAATRLLRTCHPGGRSRTELHMYCTGLCISTSSNSSRFRIFFNG